MRRRQKKVSYFGGAGLSSLGYDNFLFCQSTSGSAAILAGDARAVHYGYIGRMATESSVILRCPAELVNEALALVLCDLAPSERREIASLMSAADSTEVAQEPLFIARRGEALCGAAWGQRQPGNYAIFWPPQLLPGEAAQTASFLAEAVVHDLDAAGIVLSQSLLAAPGPALVKMLQHVGFQHSADLLYLTCESGRFPIVVPTPSGIEFEEYTAAERGRLTRVIEQTYKDTMDCTALDGARDLEDVMNGYQATGVFRPQNWLIVRHQSEDIGVLLLADHPQARQVELMYMGIVLEWRGRGWGRQIALYAQWRAHQANAERILVAVDAANRPAVDVYRSTGFEIWDRRAVFLRFLPRKSES